MASAIQEQINAAVKDAMRAKDKPRLQALRLATAEFKRIEVDERIELDDARVIQLLDKMVKQRRESIRQFTAGGREDLAAQEQAEIEIFQEYLPAQLSTAEITQLIEDAIQNSGASSIKDMGKVMGIIKPQVQGRGDMSVVSGLIKEKLG